MFNVSSEQTLYFIQILAQQSVKWNRKILLLFNITELTTIFSRTHEWIDDALYPIPLQKIHNIIQNEFRSPEYVCTDEVSLFFDSNPKHFVQAIQTVWIILCSYVIRKQIVNVLLT